MQDNPDDLFYTESHEWISVDGAIATIGITEHAQAQMGELVFVELPEVGDVLDEGNEAGVVESVKTASDFYCPLNGEVIEVNALLLDNPAMVNEHPYAEGWLYKLKIDKPEQLESLMNADDYSQLAAD